MSFSVKDCRNHIVFTPLGFDNFAIDASPLNEENWTLPTDYTFPLQALGGFCVSTETGVGGDANLFTGVVFPNDQYAQIGLSAMGNSDVVVLGIRVDPTGDTSGVFFNILSRTSTTLNVSVSDGTNTLYSNAALPFKLGDSFKLAAVGTSVTLYQNLNLLTTVTPLVPSTGNPFIVAQSSVIGSTKLSNFIAGSVRNSIYPNSSRNINGTLTYDVQTSSNPAVPGTDSRTAGAPVASGTYPQNSRTPGTYGPGE